MFYVLVIEVKEFKVVFRDRKVILRPRDFNYVRAIFGFRESSLYRCKVKLIDQRKK